MNSDKTEAQQGARNNRREPVFRPVSGRSYAQKHAIGAEAASSITHLTLPTLPPQANVAVKPTAAAATGSGPGASGASGHAGTGGKVDAAARPAGTSKTATTVAVPPQFDDTGIPELERMKGVGDTLNGRFVLEQCIGSGGMGTVYKALDLRKLEASDRKPYIAIKVLNVHFRGHPKSLIALQREARKAQALAHPNIVAVYDFDRDGSMVYLTMEYLVGQPLSSMLRSEEFIGLSSEKALPIITGMAHALAYAHQRGFVHCDLKPANVFLNERGAVKVIDFGIARVFQKPEEDNEATVFDAGSLGGLTPAYASPEMLEHREPDPRDDIYALACITYELLTGRHPFDRMAATQARGIGMQPLRPKGLGWRQWRALRCALCFEREARTPSVTQFLAAIGDDGRTGTRMTMAAGAVVCTALAATAVVHYRGTHPAGDAAAWGDASTASASDGATTDVSGGIAGGTTSAGKLPFRPADGGTVQVPAVATATRAGSGRQPINFAAIAPVLVKIPCSALSASTRDNAIDVKGFLSQRYGAVSLKAALAKIPGVETVNLDVQPVADLECGMVDLLAPFWTRSRVSGASIRTRAAGGQMAEGEPLVLDLATPAYDSWVHVDYYVLDGGVVHLLPSVRARDYQAPPSYRATIGGLGNWVISRPFGNELIVLVTTPEPLFTGLRPENENARDYLRALKKQLKQMTSKYGVERVAVDFVQIATRPKS
ncbi:MAG: protein kinase [Herminiimonas sp.]|nr:protein kinase [Herminiimonas sp.]